MSSITCFDPSDPYPKILNFHSSLDLFSAMSQQISSQANKFWQLLTAPSTLDTYRQAINLTWSILKEAILLIWLVICLVLVLGDWFWEKSVGLGRQTRIWVNGLQTVNTDQMASNAGKAIVSAGKNSLTYTLAQAREQLGLPEKSISPSLPAPSGGTVVTPVEVKATSEPTKVTTTVPAPQEKPEEKPAESVQSTT